MFSETSHGAGLNKTQLHLSQRKRGDALLSCSKVWRRRCYHELTIDESRELETLTSGRKQDEDKQLPAAATLE